MESAQRRTDGPPSKTHDTRYICCPYTWYPAGFWTTYAELSELSNIPAVEVRARLSANPPNPAVRRVMTTGGRIDAVAPWAAENLAAYRQQLVAEGVLPTADANDALPDAKVTAPELSDLIGEA